jgi:hypothetical protein
MTVSEAKASLKGQIVHRDRPETRRSNHEQGELCRSTKGGPNPLLLQ